MNIAKIALFASIAFNEVVTASDLPSPGSYYTPSEEASNEGGDANTLLDALNLKSYYYSYSYYNYGYYNYNYNNYGYNTGLDWGWFFVILVCCPIYFCLRHCRSKHHEEEHHGHHVDVIVPGENFHRVDGTVTAVYNPVMTTPG